jgi:hypothetical protein
MREVTLQSYSQVRVLKFEVLQHTLTQTEKCSVHRWSEPPWPPFIPVHEGLVSLQGYLARKKAHPPRTLP